MFGGSNWKTKIPTHLVVLSLMLLNCVAIRAEEPLIYVQANINKGYIHYNEVTSKYGEIWIGYTIANSKVITSSGFEYFVIERANYYYKKDDNYILMGSVDKTGLYDKNGVCLKEPPKIASGYQVVGISSSLIERSILSPTFILQSTSISDIYQETESFAIVDIDTQQDTLKLMDMSRFLAP